MKRYFVLLVILVITATVFTSCAGAATTTKVAVNSTQNYSSLSEGSNDSGQLSSAVTSEPGGLSEFEPTSSEDISSILAQASSENATSSQIIGRVVIKKVVTKIPGTAETSSQTQSNSSVQQTTDKKIKIMAIGETTTQGGYPDESSSAYRQWLYDMYTAAGISTEYVGTQNGYSAEMKDGNIYHCGYGGATVKQLAEELMPQITQCTAPDIILLMIGRNDITAKTTVDDYILYLTSVITKLEEAFPNAEIYVGSVPPSRKYDGSEELYVNQLETDYYNRLKEMVTESESFDHPVHFVDMSAEASGLTWQDFNNSEDNYVYPDANGYAKIATAWFNATIDSMLK